MSAYFLQSGYILWYKSEENIRHRCLKERKYQTLTSYCLENIMRLYHICATNVVQMNPALKVQP